MKTQHSSFGAAIANGAREITPEEARARIHHRRNRLTSRLRRGILRKREALLETTFAECAAFVPESNTSLPTVRPLVF